MGKRANPSGVRLTDADAAVVKGMLKRGDRQHDIAAFFGVNGGRIAEIATGDSFSHVPAASPEDLPPAGPYPPGRVAIEAMAALASAKAALATAEALIAKHRV